MKTRKATRHPANTPRIAMAMIVLIATLSGEIIARVADEVEIADKSVGSEDTPSGSAKADSPLSSSLRPFSTATISVAVSSKAIDDSLVATL